MKRKVLSILLAMAVVSTGLPSSTVFAAGRAGTAWEVNQEQTKGVLENGVYKQTFTSSSSGRDIQEALNYTKEGKAQKVEITLKGKIEINGRLTVYSNTTINAEGAVIREADSNGALLVSATARDFEGRGYKSGYKTTENITVNGGTWDGAKSAGQVIHFVHATNVTLNGLTVKNCTDQGHLISLEGVDTATVKGCTLTGYSKMADVKEAIHLDIVHSEVTTPDLEKKEYDDLPNRNITITNNVVSDVPNAIGSHGAVEGIHHQNITITNNKLNNIKFVPIKIYNYKNVTISGNTISNSGNGIKIYTYVQSTGTGDDADGVYYKPNSKAKTEPLPKNNDYNITATGNKITNTTNPGIQVQGSKQRPMSNIKLEDNTINKTGSKGIWLLAYCPNTLVKNNTISNTASSGVDARSYCDKSVIEKNTVSNSKESAICVMTNISNVSVKDNTIQDTTDHGIWAYKKATGTKITGNTINGVTKHGIYVSSKSNKATVQNNQIKGTVKQNGIYIHQSTSANVGKNKIGNVGKIGIYIDTGSDSAKVSGNTIGTCKAQGISVYKSAKAVLSKNKITKASGNGIQVSSAKTRSTITDNTIGKAGKNGIHIYQAPKATVSGNEISNSKERGINLGAGCSSAKVSGNDINNSGTQGISAYQASSPTVSGNTVNKTGKEGISIGSAGKTTKVTKNRVIDTKKSGINVWGTQTATISENVLQNISGDAILPQNVKANVGTVKMTQIDKVTKKSKAISGKARAGSVYTVTVGNQKYTAKVKYGVFKTGRISKLKSGTKVTVTETMKKAGKNQLITVIKVK